MRNVSFVGIFFFLFIVSGAFAQGNYEIRTISIIENLHNSIPGKGEVVIKQPSSVHNLIGRRRFVVGADSSGSDEMVLKTQGYRAQVFSGNLRDSKDEAFNKEKEIKEIFPELHTYVTYVAPFWRLRVGDYRSHEEAYRTMRMLMNALPNYAREMYIIREEIRIPLY